MHQCGSGFARAAGAGEQTALNASAGAGPATDAADFRDTAPAAD
jgi:hypothetical protein